MIKLDVIKCCADCGCDLRYDHGPPGGWELEDGRTVCQRCCANSFSDFLLILDAVSLEACMEYE